MFNKFKEAGKLLKEAATEGAEDLVNKAKDAKDSIVDEAKAKLETTYKVDTPDGVTHEMTFEEFSEFLAEQTDFRISKK